MSQDIAHHGPYLLAVAAQAVQMRTLEHEVSRLPAIIPLALLAHPTLVVRRANLLEDATQKAMRRENPNQLSTRDARVLMGIPSVETGANEEQVEEKRATLPSLFAQEAPAPVEARRVVSSPAPVQATRAVIPPRPSRETRRTPSEVRN